MLIKGEEIQFQKDFKVKEKETLNISDYVMLFHKQPKFVCH